jgi:DNA-binding transcriptional LysR family regulator
MQKSFTPDLGHLRTLREVQERGTVTAAADALHLTPSAVSQQIAALAQSVGAPLLARSGRRIRLTAQAHVLLEHLDLINAELERARADLDAFALGEVGRVGVAAFATAITGLVVPTLSILGRSHPGLTITVEEVEAPACFSRLDAGTIDIAIAVDYARGPRRDDPRYQRVELLRDPLRVVVPDGHPASFQEAVDIAQLAEDGWVIGADDHPCYAITMAAYAAASITPRIVHRTNDWGAAIALVASGSGIALVPALALTRKHAGIAVLPVRGQEPARTIYAAVRRGSEEALRIRLVLDVLSSVAARLRQPDKPR